MNVDPADGLNAASRELLLDVLAGELTATHPDVLATIAKDRDFAAALERHLFVHHSLAQLATASADPTSLPPDAELDALAQAALRRHMQAQAPLSRPRPRRSLWFGVAAAVVLAAVGSWWLFGGGGSPSQRQQLSGKVGVVAMPDGSGLQFDYTTLPHEGFFTVKVSAGNEVLLTAPRERRPTWRPAPEAMARWPAEVTVEVIAWSAPGIEVARGNFVWRRQ